MRWIVAGLVVVLGVVLIAAGYGFYAFGGVDALQHAYWRRPQAEMIRTRLDPVVLPVSRVRSYGQVYVAVREDSRGVQLIWLEGNETSTLVRAKWNGAAEVTTLAQVDVPFEEDAPQTPLHSGAGADVYFVHRADNARWVYRVPVAGGSAERVLTAGRTAYDFAVNEHHLFWTEQADDGVVLMRWPLRGGPVEAVYRAVGDVQLTLSARDNAIAMAVSPREFGGPGGVQIWLGEGSAPPRQIYTSAHQRVELCLGEHHVFVDTSEEHLETPKPASLWAIARRGGGARMLATLGARSAIVVLGDRAVVATQEHHRDNSWMDKSPRSWTVMAYDARGGAQQLVRIDVEWLNIGLPTGGESVLLVSLPGGGADQTLQLLSPGW